MSDPLHIGNNHQLFLDDYIIQSCENVTRRVNPVDKHPANPVIRPEEDWEPRGYVAYGSVIYDEEEKLYKCWCQSVGGAPALKGLPKLAGEGTFYFESEDGITWRKPELGVFTVNGRSTHIVEMWNHNWIDGDDPYQEVFGAFKDAQETDPAKRYKLAFLYLKWNYWGDDPHASSHGQLRALGVACSPDGKNWEAIEGPVAFNTADGGTHWFRDPTTNRFVLFGRAAHWDPAMLEKYIDDERFGDNQGRSVRRSESDDFIHWEPAEGEIVMSADVLDGPGDEIYAMNVFPYQGVYVAFVQVLHNYADCLYLDVQLGISRDGKKFERLSDRSPFIPVGGVGEWDRFNNSLTTNPPHQVGDELRVYYAGRTYLHAGIIQSTSKDNARGKDYIPQAAIGFGTIKVDRFCGMESGFEGGVLRTKPVIVEGKTLHLNAYAKFGRVDISLCDSDGAYIEGVAAQIREQDAVDAPLAIDLTPFVGQAIAMEFKITNAKLFSFWID